MQYGGRPSPTESATEFPVGTIKKGNDNIIKVTKANIKRWVKYNGTQQHRSVKKSTKRKSTKRKSTKRSAKKQSAKKSAKHSAKKQSAKKSVKRSTKKQSTKRRSVKSKQSTKHRSIKKSKQSTKHRSTKKQSTKRRSAKKSTKRSAKKSTKRSAKKSTKRSAKKSTKRSAKKSTKRSTKKSTKRSTKKQSVKSTKRSAKKSTKRSTKKSTKRSTKKQSVKSTKRSAAKSKNNSEIQNKKYNPNTFITMLAHKYTGEDIIGWYLSEKLDGYRAIYYNGKFMSRNNKPFNAPEFFVKNFPKDIVLDGELYTKRNDFEGMGIVRKKIPVNSEWEKITYQVFDLPLIRLPFEERYDLLKKTVKGIPYIKVVNQHLIKSQKEFDTMHKELVSKGAEGSMLRQPGSFYEHKRSKTLLKVKDFFDDEAIIVDTEYGEGRNSEVLGNLIVKWAPSAKQSYKGTFDVGSGFNDEERKNWKKLFKKGTVITIKYWEIQPSGKPRFPIFQRIRKSE
jgi:DNA ligase-1